MNTNDSFLELLNNNIKESIENNPFKINNIKLIHHHFNSGDLDIGSPIETSLELRCKFNFKNNKLNWTKTISHTYYNLFGDYENTTDFFSVDLDNCASLISELEKIDLRNLKNNYFTDKNPERFTHWEIQYNHNFKIAGTYDKEIDEMKKLSELLNFKNVIKEECRKITNKINENK